MKRCNVVLLLVLGLSLCTFLSAVPATAAPADTVVGDGTAASCDGNALEAAVTAGGLVTFNCGGAHTILANTMVLAAGTTTVVDGGGLITISGEGLRQIFIVNGGASLTLNHVTLTGGAWSGNGGAVVVYGALTLNNSTVRDSQATCGVCDGTDGIGGGIAVEGAGNLTLANSQILANQAATAGGGVGLNGGTMTATASIFDHNQTSGKGGALWTKAGTTLQLTGGRLPTTRRATQIRGLAAASTTAATLRWCAPPSAPTAPTTPGPSTTRGTAAASPCANPPSPPTRHLWAAARCSCSTATSWWRTPPSAATRRACLAAAFALPSRQAPGAASWSM